MTGKEYLNQYYWGKRNIESLRDEILQLEAMAEYVSPVGSTVRSSGFSDKVGKAAANIADKKKKLERMVEETLELMNDIEAKIEQIDNERYRWILRERYLHFRKWNQIAQRAYYSLRTVQYNNKKALEAFEKKFPEIEFLSVE